jgi:TMEM175 potassium channel family protein
MTKGRVEAFSDGVIAIIITIMVLELKTPEHATWAGLCERWPTFVSYVLSFFFVGVYWVNHHHLLHSIRHVNGKILWLNLHLLFWLSLLPFMTRWLGESYPAPVPTFCYGIVMLFGGVSWGLLQSAIAGQTTAEEQGAHRHQLRKTLLAMALAGTALPLAWYGHVHLAVLLYAAISLSWAIPDRTLERVAGRG